MKWTLNSIVGAVALCAALTVSAATPLTEMVANGVVYGYRDPANCVTWSKHAKYLNQTMYYTTMPRSAFEASVILYGKTIDGVDNWRLPSLDEFRSFYAAVGAQGMSGGAFQAIDAATGTVVTRVFDVGSPTAVHYWSSDVQGTVVYGFVASNGGIVPHSYVGGARLYVWAVRSPSVGCRSALVSPFAPAK